MDAYARLKKYTLVSACQNRRGFRQALAQLSLATPQLPFKLLSTIKRQTLNPTTTTITATALEKTYAELTNLLLTTQTSISENRLRHQCKSAATRLAAQAILFHLNFFKPNPTRRQGKTLRVFGTRRVGELAGELTRIFANKNRDYGNSFRFWGVPGLLVRLGDKVLRLRQLSQNESKTLRVFGTRRVKDEKIPDTALDLANYALMLLMLLEEGRSLKLGR